MKQIVSSYSYSPTTNVVTLTGLNVDADQLLLIVAPQVGRTMYNFASVTGVVSAGADTRITLNASTAGLTTTSPLVIFYDDQAGVQSVTGTVALDPASLIALENVTVTVGSSVSISNFPSTQTIAGTVTVGNTVTAALRNYTVVTSGVLSSPNGSATFSLASVGDGSLIVLSASLSGSAPVYSLTQGTLGQGDITLSVVDLVNQEATTTFGGDTLVGLIKPKTDSNFNLKYISGSLSGSYGQYEIRAYQDPSYRFPQPVNGTVTVGNSITIGSLPAISGTVTAIAHGINIGGTNDPMPLNMAESEEAFLNGRRLAVSIIASDGAECGTNFPLSVSGTVTANVSNGALTTRFGTPTTANTAFSTSAVTNANRKYLLIQNVTTQSNVITVGIGFTPTTTQGIQLTAGAGITFESSYIPTGAVQILSSVTASNFTILEA